jgi:signal transduction histidine kinase
MKDEFLATLSHELRSPLGVILTWVALLRSGRIDDAGRARAFEAIERNTRHQAKLIEDLLDVSRIISGKMRLDVGVVNLVEVVDAALEGVRHAADAKVIHLDFDHDATLGPVSGDPARLQQIVWNLLSNAVKFTPEGGKVSVAAKLNGSAVEVSVIDTGVGIAPEDQAIVFEEFRQVGRDYTRKAEGTGLGLALTRRFVELHGGVISLASTPGKGSTFTFTLPIRHGE